MFKSKIKTHFLNYDIHIFAKTLLHSPIVERLKGQPLDRHWGVWLFCIAAPSLLQNLWQAKVTDFYNVPLAQQHVASGQVTVQDLIEQTVIQRIKSSFTFFEVRYSIPRATWHAQERRCLVVIGPSSSTSTSSLSSASKAPRRVAYPVVESPLSCSEIR